LIFTSFFYFSLLVPSSALYRFAPYRLKAYVIASSGFVFFVYFSFYDVGGAPGALCVLLLVWEAIFSRLYAPRSLFCVVGIIQAVAILFVFKYWNFVIGFLPGRLPLRLHWAGQFLPLGISFFTFEFIHYAVERWRGRVERGLFREYLAFIMFFPTMVAGPIKRFGDFLPKIRGGSADFAIDWRAGITRILVGLVKKLAIADLLASATSNLSATHISMASRPTLLLWILAYGIKIYADFSGYSDIAIGSARLFGIRVPENFSWPYCRRNIGEFWTHWHISLSSWLRDYIYIPLGGSRVREPRIVFNLIVTMLVSGIWHGAGLNFLAWGAWHGLMMSTLRIWRTWFPKPLPGVAGYISSWALTFCFVNLGWAFFCMDLPTAQLFFRHLFLV
jgi:alginate O-acetyltransferase complex protein AlgI